MGRLFQSSAIQVLITSNVLLLFYTIKPALTMTKGYRTEPCRR